MRIPWTALLIPALTAPLFAGALTLEIVHPDSDMEAVAKHAAVVVRTTACNSPEKTVMTGTADGTVNGKRESIPLQLTPLSKAGEFAVGRAWPAKGTWVIRVTARNPDYRNYATGVLITVHDNEPDWRSVRRLYRAPTGSDVAAALAGEIAEKE